MITNIIAIMASAVIVALIGYPIVKWLDKAKKEMDGHYDRTE